MVNVDMIGRPLTDQTMLPPLLALAGIDPDASVGVDGLHGRGHRISGDPPIFRETPFKELRKKACFFCVAATRSSVTLKGVSAGFQNRHRNTVAHGQGEHGFAIAKAVLVAVDRLDEKAT